MSNVVTKQETTLVTTTSSHTFLFNAIPFCKKINDELLARDLDSKTITRGCRRNFQVLYPGRTGKNAFG